MIVLKQNTRDDVERALDALDAIEPPLDRDGWVKLLMAAHDAGISEDDARAWSERGPNFDERAFRSTWRGIKPGAVTARTLYKVAIDAGWRAPTERKSLTAEQMAEYDADRARRREQADKERAEGHAEAAQRAQRLWEAAAPADTHPYLDRKAVLSHGLRVGNWEYVDATTGEVYQIPNCLLLPMRDRSRKLWSLQCIESDSSKAKRYLKGGAKRGNFFPVGSKPLEHEGRKVLVLGEGYATCASVHESTGHMVLVCFDSSNLLAVAQQVRERDPEAIILFAADNDLWNRKPDGTPYNPGVEAATKAAKEVGGLVAIPPFIEGDAWGKDEKGNPTGPKDFNDWHGINGGQSVADVIARALARPTTVVLAPDRQSATGAAYAMRAIQLGKDVPGDVAALSCSGTSDLVVEVYGADLAQRVAKLCARYPSGHIYILARVGDEQVALDMAERYGVRAEILAEFGGGRFGNWFDAMLAELDDVADANPAAREMVGQSLERAVAAQEAQSGAGALEAALCLNENDVSQHAKAIAKTIEFKLAKAFNIERDDPNYQKQVEAFGIKADVIERMIHGSFWSGTRSKLFFLNESQALNQYTSMDCYKFLVRAFGSPVDAKVIESATDAAASAPGMPKGDAKELRKSVADAVGGTILDHLKYWNQRESVEWRMDMFAHEARMLLPEDKARIVLTHKPFDVPGSYEQEIIADYKQHFTRFDEFLEFLVMSRFALDRKKCYLWLLADSDWGKGFLLGVLSALGLAVCTSMKEIEAMFEGRPVGRAPEEFKRAFAMVVDEFKVVKSELKQLQSEITLSPKHQLTASVEVFAKLFMSAESVGSLVTSHGIEDQFANRMSIFQEAGSLVHRPLYVEAGNPRYFASVLAYTAETLNRLVAKMQEMGRIDAQTCAERWINGFIGRYGLDTLYERFSDSLPQVAADALPWLYKQNDYLVRDGSGLETRYYLTSASKVLDDYLNAHFDASEAPGYRKKKADMLKLISADGRGAATHRINGKPTMSVLLMKAGSSAGDLAAEKQ